MDMIKEFKRELKQIEADCQGQVIQFIVSYDLPDGSSDSILLENLAIAKVAEIRLRVRKIAHQLNVPNVSFMVC
jgi:hypothetical protein